MSQYTHETVSQEYIIEKISDFNFTIRYKSGHPTIVSAKFRDQTGFWNLEQKLDNGLWIPIEIEWISSNFKDYKHHEH